MDEAREVVPRDGDNDQGHDQQPVTEVTGGMNAVPLTASARLRAAREAQGLTTTDIAARTRITIRHVQALDRGDLAALPGRPYVLGFVRNYARAVGLDGVELAQLARNEMDASVPRPAPRMVHQFDVDDPAKTPSRLVTWVALALVVAVLAAGAMFWRSYYSPDAALPSLAEPEQTTAAIPAAAVAGIPARGALVASGPVVFTSRQDAIWVKFYDGHGKQLLQKQLATGETYTVPADAFEPRLWTGRPDALMVTIGGQAVAPISDKRGIVRDVPVTAQALLARAQPVAPPPPAAGATVGPIAQTAPAIVPPAVSAQPVVPAQRRPAHHRTHRVNPDNSAVAPSAAAVAPVATPVPAPAATQ